MGRLLIFANDPASANVTMAYLYLNKNKHSEVLAYPTSTAYEIYSQHIKQYISEKQIKFLETDTVVTGTSGIDPSYELSIIKKANNKNVQNTITIVDNTLNFNMRFTINNTIADKNYLAKEIWVFDKEFKSDVVDLSDRLVYKKNIYNTFLKMIYKNNIPKIEHKFIQKYKNNYLVILTEYIYELYSLKFGFTEYDMLENILRTIDKLKLNIPIFLKLHPKEYKNKFSILLRKYSQLNIIQDKCNIQELIYYSKVVFGINSSVFQECKLFKKDVYSIQINSNKIIKIILLDKSSIIYTKDKLEILLKDKFEKM